MRKFPVFLITAGIAFSSVAADEPGARERLSPEETRQQTEEVNPSSPNIENRGNPTKGPNAYGEPTDTEGKERLGNSETPGTTNGGQENYYTDDHPAPRGHQMVD